MERAQYIEMVKRCKFAHDKLAELMGGEERAKEALETACEDELSPEQLKALISRLNRNVDLSKLLPLDTKPKKD